MSDYIVRATAGEGQVRAFAAYTRETVNEARRLHGTSPVATAALGRALTGAAIMGCDLKNDTDILTINMRGDGPLRGLTVTTDNKSNVKGYVYEPNVDIPLKPNGKLDVSGAVGFGNMSVIKDLGLKEPMVGQVPIVSGEIAEDLTYYYATSEQIPSAVGLGVLVDRDLSVKQAGGFIIQMMPGASEDIIAKLEEKLASVDSITNLLEKGNMPEDILAIILGDCGLKIHEKLPVNYYCNCSKEKVERALISVGTAEIEDIIKTEGFADIHCHFCNKDYRFEKEGLYDILEKIKQDYSNVKE